jgi:hypothetical protein
MGDMLNINRRRNYILYTRCAETFGGNINTILWHPFPFQRFISDTVVLIGVQFDTDVISRRADEFNMRHENPDMENFRQALNHLDERE